MNPRFHRALVMGLSLASLCRPSPAIAQAAQSTEAPRLPIGYVDAGEEPGFYRTSEEVQRSLRRATKKFRLAGMGLGLSAASVPSGAALIAVGVVRNLCIFSPCPVDRGASAMLVTGTVMVVGGVIGLGVSGSALASARRDKRRLEKALAPTTLRLGPTGAVLTHHF